MWKSRTKEDLIIEVWEALDCESVGAREILAIEQEVRDVFGENAVDMPMRTARTLADEGAELRHAEILELDVRRRTDNPFEHFFKTIFTTTDLEGVLNSIRRIDDLRRRLESEKEKETLRALQNAAIAAKERCRASASNRAFEARIRDEAEEAAQWISIWLESPDVFEHWISLRKASDDYRNRFPETKPREEQPF